ncbi:Druantia anti-phage system protein DruA [Roseicella aerolata]|uniref:DUF4338 domain-containing protein n=1 Tax=Roseicella aerolata TaxID=2883479 RepID=A0A9X1IBK1_9PROT|nr:Druantia anti-phage system protein DruA [Roseicella aerolata]MCB4821236.1 DUF4338 domain-containing protein [Roseicella aerolata]
MTASDIEFRPSLLDQLRRSLLIAEVRDSANADPLTRSGKLRRMAEEASARSLSADEVGEMRLAVAASVLADLAEQGWDLHAAPHSVFLIQPDPHPLPGETFDHAKARVREQLMRASNRQLASEAVQDFLRSVERDRVYADRIVSIKTLIDDGTTLASKLSTVAALPPDRRAVALRSVVQPAIQLCDDQARCEFTGLPLQDVWRYFRHTWSLEYNPLPGRTMRLLIRNKARPNWPVIGIAMLASPAANLYSRDEWIGWRLDDVIASILDDRLSASRVGEVLLQTVLNAIRDIRSDDLLSPAELADPTGAVFLKLQQAAARASVERQRDLKRRDRQLLARRDRAPPDSSLGLFSEEPSLETELLLGQLAGGEEGDTRGQDYEVLFDVDESSSGQPVDIRGFDRSKLTDADWLKLSGSSLFRRKRAEQLIPLLRCLKLFKAAGFEVAPGAALCEILLTKGGRNAVTLALRELRRQKLATEVADVAVCGAIAPYNHILGGKLVTLLMCSQEVRDLYAARYANQASEIASQLAGRTITRSADLKLLTTTSLYGIASSQYNRLKVKPGWHPKLSQGLAWEELRPSDGITVTHLSKLTLEYMRRLGKAVYGTNRINSVFGEGSSPRTRQVREGLNLIGINNDRVLKQSIGRRVYACELFPGARDSLTGFAKVAASRKSPAAATIARVWQERWLLPRIEKSFVLQRVEKCSPDLISQDLRERAKRATLERSEFEFERAPADALTADAVQDRLDL